MLVDRKTLSPWSQAQAVTPFDPSGTWQNELGSTMVIARFDGANFSGTYSSVVSAKGGSVDGVLTGTLNGDAIGFLVNWGEAASSVSSWSGLVLAEGGTGVLYTLWNVASTPTPIDDAWESILAGADIFLRSDSIPQPSVR